MLGAGGSRGPGAARRLRFAGLPGRPAVYFPRLFPPDYDTVIVWIDRDYLDALAE